MNAIKILHCADLHFDTPFGDLSREISEIRKEEIKETFSKIIKVAKSEKVDMFFIAGDLFDNLTAEKSTLEFIRSAMESLNDIKVFIAAGNHDPYSTNSFYSMIQWPENVYIFNEDIEAVEIPELNTVVYGASFKEKYIKSSNLKGFIADKKYENHIKLMILHGDISQTEGGNEYNPITLEQIEKSSVDYLALGHRHSFSNVNRVGNTYYAYSGCPEARGFDELGDKGVIIGEVSKNYVNLEFRPVCKRRYRIKEIDITGLFTSDEIKDKIISSLSSKEMEDDLFKIILKGEVSEEFIIREKVIENKLKENFFFIKIIDNTSLKVDYEALRGEFSIKGIFSSKLLKEIAECEDEDEKEVLNLALKLGIQSLSEGEVSLDEN
ncbi:DNA repair exonuclease SbcCD nuclease subunit [Clostridium cavendishii DSM 21758]|uniref:DNA repair exonuclease SbcCD nuclease subunit n=1 Tax=Clostridium cavendishii DSM 21758 TaxID=1121302 RepID=A0A1M6UDV2_9CLOT|nr:DNA repair exonuclease [Clostridium cavendishii]SHK67343.1 DNA repair exonuclease SbcCD nuclease subunit [Clostridium cavendishii DSM 21758]